MERDKCSSNPYLVFKRTRMGTMIKDWMLNSERGQCCVYSWLNYLFGLGERIPVPFHAKVESGGGIEI